MAIRVSVSFWSLAKIIDWVINWLIDLFIHSLIHSLIDWLINKWPLICIRLFSFSTKTPRISRCPFCHERRHTFLRGFDSVAYITSRLSLVTHSSELINLMSSCMTEDASQPPVAFARCSFNAFSRRRNIENLSSAVCPPRTVPCDERLRWWSVVLLACGQRRCIRQGVNLGRNQKLGMDGWMDGWREEWSDVDVANAAHRMVSLLTESS